MWQVSGAHGSIDSRRAIAEMPAYHDAGFTSWDLADHYGPAEDFIGAFRSELAARRGEQSLASIQAFTKWVPRPSRMTRQVVEENVKLSLTRMGVNSLDLLQFHWWKYDDPNYLEALKYLSELRDERKIKHLALTNFDTQHLQIVVEHGIEVVSNQVQYSLVDRRPEVRMAAFCEASGVKLLTYGTLCGGLLSEKYLGRPEPRRSELNTASLMKYKNMIDRMGRMEPGKLLTTLENVADKRA
jgi:aryl-alcohol dehydrogenase-like predicted oxidoreductase